MKEIHFVVVGKIIQWQRAVHTINKKTNRIVTHNNKDHVVYQNLIKEAFKNVTDVNVMPFDDKTAIDVTVNAYFFAPKTMPKKYLKALQNGEKVRRLRTPDDDNIAKMVLDSLNKIGYPDDKQCSIHTASYWTIGQEHLEITLKASDNLAW